MLSNLFSENIVSGTPVHKVFLTQFLKERKYLSPVVKQIGECAVSDYDFW